jgi:predicted O-linked N-acetylglucosamine transferase (SPINDLY family)
MSDTSSLLALGEAAMRAGDARVAANYFRDVLAKEPGNAAALEQLAAALFAYGHTLRSRGAREAAATAFHHAAQAAPDNADVWLALGNACMEVEMLRVGVARAVAQPAQHEEDVLAHALLAFTRAAALQPGSSEAQARRAMAARYACAWHDAREAESALARVSTSSDFSCEPMSALALLDDASVQRRAIEGWAREHLPVPAAPAAITTRGTRLRVGYLSSDLHDHATAYLTAGLFELTDRARFETFAYACDRDDGSAMRTRLRAAFDHWRDIRELDDDAASRLMNADALDVLVDLKGHTHGSRIGILARRPAQVQLHYLGFPGTLGFHAIDGIVVDDIVAPPGSEGEFAESLLRLPVCYQVNDHRRELPPATSRADAGLPDHGLVLACFNQTYKLTEAFVALWLDVLRENEDAVLWLTVPHELARRHLHAFAERSGVAPRRVIFAPMVPQSAHIARLRCADLALDVLPYGSHTTGSDALFAGVPLLTCRGTTFAGRVGATLCTAAGLADLVTESPPQYAARLRELCADRARIAHYRHQLQTQRAHLPLFDTEAFTRAFERALEGASASACAR